MLVVVPDTNPLFGVLTADSSDAGWQRLLGLAGVGQIQLVLPELVQWELANQLREGLSENLRRFDGQAQKLRSLGLTPPPFLDGAAQADDILMQATERLRSTVLWHRGRIAPVPSIPTAELVQRSLERRAPFDQQDRGMRDTLLWLTVLEIAAEGSTVILISRDKQAFGSGKLHPQLVEEAARRCGSSSRVLLAEDCDEAVRLVNDRADRLRAAAERLFDEADILAPVMDTLAEAAAGEILDDRALANQGWPPELVGVRVLGVREFTSANVETVDSRPDQQLTVRMRVGVIADLDVRHDPTQLEYNDWMDLLDNADVADVGTGLVDPWAQVHMSRPVELVGDVVLGSARPPDVRLAAVELRRRQWLRRQLSLELSP